MHHRNILLFLSSEHVFPSVKRHQTFSIIRVGRTIWFGFRRAMAARWIADTIYLNEQFSHLSDIHSYPKNSCIFLRYFHKCPSLISPPLIFKKKFLSTRTLIKMNSVSIIYFEQYIKAVLWLIQKKEFTRNKRKIAHILTLLHKNFMVLRSRQKNCELNVAKNDFILAWNAWKYPVFLLS